LNFLYIFQKLSITAKSFLNKKIEDK
jgi:hypothetical protein